MRIRSGRIERKYYDRAGQQCGAIPGDKPVVVVDGQPRETLAFSHIYRPADLYLNGKGADANGYTIEPNNLFPL